MNIYEGFDVTDAGKLVFSINYDAVKDQKGWLDFYKSLNNKIEDSYICDCELNYGKRCNYPSKYRTTGCDGGDE